VAHFLRVRFPICLACNKVDDPRASSHLANIRAACPYDCIVPVSAIAELALLQSRRRGELRYADGGGATAGAQPPPPAAAVLAAYGATGVLESLRRATRLRASTLVFPVGSVETCVGVDVAGGTNTALVLPDCVMLRSGSTVQVCAPSWNLHKVV
jgi:ribosome-binding ATPase YchF (GTP1/OBG family)